MELVKLNRVQKTLIVSCWISAITGILSLLLTNISILTDINLENLVFILIFCSLILGILGLFTKASRSVSIFGLSIAIFQIFFIGVVFFLGWMIVPFP
ncbi:hypothetical protein AZF04_16940 [Alkalihalobacillus trypoxylicola]|uniref:DUF4064 domain-containing protein n=1 Tax=Alkalihalobacillus trypoxylicola TaxID=519424 RepID=A0A162EP87_9BACI|nr:hypothetical protein AZF04_16940 [Alkalihalobacillus trypoxylicola]